MSFFQPWSKPPALPAYSTQCLRTRLHSAASFVEGKNRGTFVPGRRCDRIGKRQGGFSDAGGPDEERVRSSLQTAAQQQVQLRVSAQDDFVMEILVMFGGNKPRIYLRPPCLMVKS